MWQSDLFLWFSMLDTAQYQGEIKKETDRRVQEEFEKKQLAAPKK